MSKKDLTFLQSPQNRHQSHYADKSIGGHERDIVLELLSSEMHILTREEDALENAERKLKTIRRDIEEHRVKNQKLVKLIESARTERDAISSQSFELEKVINQFSFELEEIKAKRERLKEEVQAIKKAINEQEYHLNREKVKLQNHQNPHTYKMLGLYLSITTVAGILLALYYFLLFNKG